MAAALSACNFSFLTPTSLDVVCLGSLTSSSHGSAMRQLKSAFQSVLSGRMTIRLLTEPYSMYLQKRSLGMLMQATLRHTHSCRSSMSSTWMDWPATMAWAPQFLATATPLGATALSATAMAFPWTGNTFCGARTA